MRLAIYNALLLSLLTVASYAQDKAPSDSPAQKDVAASGSSNNPQLKINPLKILEDSQPPADEPYSLGAGDTINVYVAGHPELSKQYVIGPDGLITLDLAGSLKLTELTRDQAAAAIRTLLAKYYIDPTVTVGVEKYGSNTIMIFGNVQHPGILAYEGTTPTLLDAIGRAGLLPNPASQTGLPTKCTIYRGANSVLFVPLESLLTNSEHAANGQILTDVRLRRGDKVFVPVNQQDFISVLGQVGKPGPVAITPDLDLKLLISRAGGLKDEAGKNPTIHIAQTATNREIAIPFKELMKPGGAAEVKLQPGDIVYVPMSGFNQVGYVLTKIAPAATMISLATLVAP
jgi:polysaccharide export outer membrane protein